MASEIRVNKINSRTGVGTITLSPTGVDFTGITTVATLKATTGIVTTFSTTGNATVGGTLGVTGETTFATHVNFGDNDKAIFGAGDDLQIYHDTSGAGNSIIKEEGTGELRLGSNNAVRITKHDSETCALFTIDGAAELYYDNTKKFETTTNGVTITGTATATEGLVLDGQTGSGKGLRLDLAGSSDYVIQETSTDDVVQFGGTGSSNFFVHNISSGNFGVGTNSPNAGLNVGLGGNTIPTAGASTGSALFGNATGGNAYGLVLGATSGGVGYISAQRADGTATTYNLVLQPNGGDIGIGTASPDYLTSIAAASGNAKLNLKRLNDASNGNAFGSLFYTNSAGNDVASVRAHRESAADNAYLAFGTRNTGGSISERLRITSTGIKRVQNGNLNIYSTYIDFSGDVSTPTTAAAIFRPADNTLAFSTGNNERLRILSGGGITFNGDTATANALDDYEEGDWTPAMNSGGWTSFTVNTAKYVKIGGQVFVQCYVSALQGSGTGNVLKLQGLPFNPISNGYTVGSVDMGEGSVKGTYCRTESDTNQISFLYPSENNSSARVTLKGNQIGDAYIILGLTYFTSS